MPSTTTFPFVREILEEEEVREEQSIVLKLR